MHERLSLLDMLPIAIDEQATGAVWRSSVLILADALRRAAGKWALLSSRTRRKETSTFRR